MKGKKDFLLYLDSHSLQHGIVFNENILKTVVYKTEYVVYFYNSHGYMIW